MSKRRTTSEVSISGRMRYVEVRCSAGVARRLDLEVEVRSKLGLAPLKRSQLELAMAPASASDGGSAPHSVPPVSTPAPAAEAAAAATSSRTTRRRTR